MCFSCFVELSLILYQGAKPAKFRVEVEPGLAQSVTVSPEEGVVSPKSEFKLVIRFEAKEGDSQIGSNTFEDIRCVLVNYIFSL